MIPGREIKATQAPHRDSQRRHLEDANAVPSPPFDLETGLQSILQNANELLDAALSLVAIRKYDGEPLRVMTANQATTSFSETDLEKLSQSLSAGWALSRRQVVDLPRAQLEAEFYLLPGLTGMIYAPLIVRGKGIGVLCLVSTTPTPGWDALARDLALRMAQQVSLVIEMARTYEDLSRCLAGDRREREIMQAVGSTWSGLNQAYMELLRETLQRHHQHGTTERAFQSRLLMSERMASLGQLIAGVAHELNNPLTAVLGFSELVMANHQLPEELRKDLSTIVAEAYRARTIVQSLLSFAHASEPKKTRIDINQVLEETLILREYELRTNQAALIKQLDPHLPPVIADPDQLKQVFLNIIVNAEHALVESPPPRRLEIKTSLVTSALTDDRIEIRFRDTGPGIPPEHLEHIFDLFFTTKEPGEGTGLGLAISHNIIEDHGGRLYAQNASDGGAEFIIELPVSP